MILEGLFQTGWSVDKMIFMRVCVFIYFYVVVFYAFANYIERTPNQETFENFLNDEKKNKDNSL